MKTKKAILYTLIVILIWLFVGGTVIDITGIKFLGWLTFIPILGIALYLSTLKK